MGRYKARRKSLPQMASDLAATCDRKRPYDTRLQAEDALFGLKRRTATRGLVVYRCPSDKLHWHVGHMVRR